jgi:uncharacterized protein YjdB
MNKNFKLTAIMLAIATFAMGITSCSGDDDNDAPAVEVTSIALASTTLNVGTGEKQTLTATLSPPKAPKETVTWTSSNPGVASVASTGELTGEVTGVTEGTATITVSSANGKIATCAVSVVHAAALTGITLTPSGEQKLYIESSVTLSAAPVPADATNYAPVWSSSNEAAATVSTTGVVTGVAAGTTTITVTSGSITASVAFTVTAAPRMVKLDINTLSIAGFSTESFVAVNLIDGVRAEAIGQDADAASWNFWHPEYGPTPPLPHWVIIDLGSPKQVGRIAVQETWQLCIKTVQYFAGNTLTSLLNADGTSILDADKKANDPNDYPEEWTKIAEGMFPPLDPWYAADPSYVELTSIEQQTMTVDVTEPVSARYLLFSLPDQYGGSTSIHEIDIWVVQE